MRLECVHPLIPSIDLFLFQQPKDDEEEGKAERRAVHPPVIYDYLLTYYFILAGPIPSSWKQHASPPPYAFLSLNDY